MAYEQIQKVSGSASTNFGKAVVINGYYAVIADDSGDGYFYRRLSTGQWSQITTFTLSGAGATFGNAIAIGNEYFIVGEPGYSAGDGRFGVYAISAPSTAVGPSLSISNIGLGSSVAISDNYLVIGASEADGNRGDVYIYTKGTGSSWTAYGSNPITPALRAADDYFGCAVAIDGDSIIVGAKGDNTKTGAVYIFELNSETELWVESQKILASDGGYNDEFGATVSASGGYFIAGASLSDISTDANVGASYVYKYGTNWYEVDKLGGIDESSYVGNNFGESVYIDGDYIIVGSPDARTTGVADIFYKKRSWGHLKKIIGSDSLVEDSFGASTSISGRFVVVGAPGEGGNGAIYFYEDTLVRLRLAQEFDVGGAYLPSKASIYLKRIGQNTTGYWPVYSTSKSVIDSTNFSTIDYGTNIITFADSISDFTGNGYMILMGDSAPTFTIVNYPVRAVVSGTFNLWIRCISTNSNTFQADILIDGEGAKTINETVANPSALVWSWINTTLVLPDTREHILGIRIKENGAAIDKIYIDASDNTPYSEGPDYGESPYLTVHMRVYDSTGDSPDNALYIYDYKNSITQIVQSDWYNFNIGVLDNSQGYTEGSDFVGSYFLVMSCSGTTHDNFVVWEMADNDEYMTLPSVFRF